MVGIAGGLNQIPFASGLGPVPAIVGHGAIGQLYFAEREAEPEGELLSGMRDDGYEAGGLGIGEECSVTDGVWQGCWAARYAGTLARRCYGFEVVKCGMRNSLMGHADRNALRARMTRGDYVVLRCVSGSTLILGLRRGGDILLRRKDVGRRTVHNWQGNLLTERRKDRRKLSVMGSMT